MINTSNEYNKRILNERSFVSKAEITLSDLTILNVDESGIMLNGIKINDGVSEEGALSIGSAIINQLTLTLDNSKEQFSTYDFTEATIEVSIGLVLSATTEYLKKGIFTVDESNAIGSTIVLTALDNMVNFDFPFSGLTTVIYPTTAYVLLQKVCEYCGVPLAITSFLNDDFSIVSSPGAEATTCREIVSYIAQISGNFARVNVDGALELKWYNIAAFEKGLKLDGGKFDSSTPYTSGNIADGGDFSYTEETTYDSGLFTDQEEFHSIYSLSSATIGTDDIIITGIQVIDTAEEPTTVLFGESGYVLSIEENPLILNATQAQAIANTVGASIVGMQFRPLSVSALSNPSMEAGDVAYVTDRKGNSYRTLITNITYTIGSYENITCDAETPSKNSSVRYSPSSKAIVEARKIAKKEISTYDLAVQQLTSLITNGFGLYKTEEADDNGGIIYYMHNQPTVEESSKVWKFTSEGLMVSNDGTTTFALDTNGNALFNVITAKGINADWINAGTITGREINNGNGTFKVTVDGALTTSNINVTGGSINLTSEVGDYSKVQVDGGDAICGIGTSGFRVLGSDGATTIGRTQSKFNGNVKIIGSLEVYKINSYIGGISIGTDGTSAINIGTSASSTIDVNGNVKLGDSYGTMGFFGSSGSSKKTISSTSASASTATESNHLTVLNNILYALRQYGLVN